MDFNLYLQNITYTLFIGTITIISLLSLVHKILDAIIVNKTPIDKLEVYYHVSALNKGIVTIPQPHREVKQIPKTKVIAKSSLRK